MKRKTEETLTEELYELMGINNTQEYKKKIIGAVSESQAAKPLRIVPNSKYGQVTGYIFHMPGYNSDGTLRVKKKIPEEVRTEPKKPIYISKKLLIKSDPQENTKLINVLRGRTNKSLPALKNPSRQFPVPDKLQNPGLKFQTPSFTSMAYSRANSRLAKPAQKSQQIPGDLLLRKLTWDALGKLSYKDVLGSLNCAALVSPSKDDAETLKLLRQFFPNQNNAYATEKGTVELLGRRARKAKAGVLSQVQSEDRSIAGLSKK